MEFTENTTRIQVSDEGDAFLDTMDSASALRFDTPIGKAAAWLMEIREEGDFIGPTVRFYKRGDNGPGEMNDADVAYSWAMSKGYLESVDDIPRRMLESITPRRKGPVRFESFPRIAYRGS